MIRHPELHFAAAALLLVAASTVAVRGFFGLGEGLSGRFLSRGGVVLQRSPSDCGLAAIATLAEAHGVSLPPYDSLLSLYPPPPGGLSVLQLTEIGAEIGSRSNVPRAQAVKEVEADKHPGALVVRVENRKYVRDNPDGSTRDNVNRNK